MFSECLEGVGPMDRVVRGVLDVFWEEGLIREGGYVAGFSYGEG